jgi:hypothetical protein
MATKELVIGSAILLKDLLIEEGFAVGSLGAIKLIRSGVVQLGDEVITDPNYQVDPFTRDILVVNGEQRRLMFVSHYKRSFEVEYEWESPACVAWAS